MAGQQGQGQTQGQEQGQVVATYKLKWAIPNELVDNIRGVERTYRVSIEYRRPWQVGCTAAVLQGRRLLRRG